MLQWQYIFTPKLTLEKRVNFYNEVEYIIHYVINEKEWWNEHTTSLISAIKCLVYKCGCHDAIDALILLDELSLEEHLILLKIKNELTV